MEGRANGKFRPAIKVVPSPLEKLALEVMPNTITDADTGSALRLVGVREYVEDGCRYVRIDFRQYKNYRR